MKGIKVVCFTMLLLIASFTFVGCGSKETVTRIEHINFDTWGDTYEFVNVIATSTNKKNCFNVYCTGELSRINTFPQDWKIEILAYQLGGDEINSDMIQISFATSVTTVFFDISLACANKEPKSLVLRMWQNI